MSPLKWIAGAYSTVKWSIADVFKRRQPGEVRLIRKPDSFERPLTEAIPVIGDVGHIAELRAATADLRRTRELEVVPAKMNGGHPLLLEDTGEFHIVFVSLTRREPKRKCKVDELGAWDPSAVDWSTPAFIFESTVRDTWTDWTATVPPEDRPGIAYALADKILCGV